MKVVCEIKFQLFQWPGRRFCPAARFMGKGQDWEYLTNCCSDGKLLGQIRRGGGMVDTGDLKSPGSNTVPVRVRSPAPARRKLCIACDELFCYAKSSSRAHAAAPRFQSKAQGFALSTGGDGLFILPK